MPFPLDIKEYSNYTMGLRFLAGALNLPFMPTKSSDSDVVFVGVGIPGLGAGLAKLTHAPNMVMASSARKTVIMINMQARRFLERVDYIT